MAIPRQSAPSGLASLSTREGWMVFFCYLLFISSLFSKAGISTSIIMTYLLVLYHRWRTPVVEKLPLWVYLPLVLFVAAGFVSALANPHPLLNLEHMRKEYRLFLPMALLPALAMIDLRRLLRVYLVFVVLIGLYAFIQYRWGVDWFSRDGVREVLPFTAGNSLAYRARGAYTPLAFGALMLMTVPLFLSLYFSDPAPRRYLWAMGAFMGAVAVFTSMSRSSWLGMGMGVLMLALRLPRRWAGMLIGLAMGALVIVSILLSTGWLRSTFSHDTHSAILQRFLVTSPERDVERFYLWEAGIRGIRDNFWLGVGLNNPDRLEPYRQQVAREHGGYHYYAVVPIIHNSYLEAAFYLGVMGFIIYMYLWIAVLFWIVRGIHRAGKALPFETAVLWGLLGAFAGILVESFFNHTFFEMEVQTALMLWMAVAFHLGLKINRLPQETSQGAAA